MHHDLGFLGNLPGSFDHPPCRKLAGLGLPAAQLAGRTLAALFLPIQQDLGLIRFTSLAVSTCLPLFLAFALLTQHLLVSLTLQLALFQALDRILPLPRLALRIEGVIATVAAQAQ